MLNRMLRRSKRLPVKALASAASVNSKSAIADHLTQVSIQLRIPLEYREKPIISQMIADYGLTVNIRSALLVTNTPGQFELELQGESVQIQKAFDYMEQLNLTTLIIG
jgi:ABC-type methionine transport system ATPase subunit